MINIIISFFVIFGVSASAELASQAPYPPSGWRPSGPEFRYPTQTPSSYLPPPRSESRAFAQASFNVQLPQRSLGLQLPEQSSWNSKGDFSGPTQGRNTWNRQQSQPQIRSRVPQQQPFNPQSPVPQQGTQFPDQFSDPARKFGTRISPAPAAPETQPSIEGSGSSSDQSSYLPPASSAYRILDYQQSPLYLSPPQEFRAVPYTEYGPPQQQYGAPPSQEYGPPPSQEYGPPAVETTTTEQPTTTESLTTTTEVTETTTEPIAVDTPTEPTSANAVEGEEHSQKLTQNEEQGIYYVYHPSGLLQRIRYTTNDDKDGMEYSARLRYENVEPINGPIYTYDPETYIFRRIN